jgi:cardiolipin synthase A/B
MMILVSMILGGLVLALLVLIALLSAVKGTPVCEVETADGRPVPGVQDPSFRCAIELLSRTKLQPGHAVELFMNGDETYPRLWNDLRAARESLTIQLYYCEPGRMADTFRDILVERARAGVKVLFLYDAFGTSFPDDYLRALTDAGVLAKPFRPLSLLTAHKMQHRAHIRVVCIDGRIGWTGGFGLSDKWFGGGRVHGEWRDSNVRFIGPAVRQLQAAFVACWAEATGDLLVGDLLFGGEDAPDDGGVLAAVLHGSPSVGSTEAERFLAVSIAAARERLYITNAYFVPDRDIRRLITAAARRGVDTRILTAGPATDIKSTLHAGRARYEELLEAGVRIYEYRDTMMHAKTLVVDGMWSACGSMNADNRSLSFNDETMLLMLDAGTATTLERHFMDDLAHSDEIDLATFRRRGAWSRLRERASHMMWRVL